MKIIFLDFNGILDTWENMDEINENNFNRLKKLIEETGANVVYSSSNRYSRFGKQIMLDLISRGINVIGVTPKLGERELEIKSYLEAHPDIENYCILDDDYDMESMKDHLVKLPLQSEGSLGFTEEYYNQALNILGMKKDKEYVGYGRR